MLTKVGLEKILRIHFPFAVFVQFAKQLLSKFKLLKSWKNNFEG